MKTLALLLAVFLPTITFADEDSSLKGEILASLSGENQSSQDDDHQSSQSDDSPSREASEQRFNGFQQKGMASWYGPGFAGRRTASGERFNPSGHTLAHRTLRLGTVVRVTNLRNHQSVIARVTDRGPFHRGRIADLSSGAASAIGLKSSGTAPVLIVAQN